MKFTKLQIPFYFGLAILALGILFKIQHYPGAELMIAIGLLLEAIFIILVLTEIVTSKKATKNLKILWVMEYTLFPILALLYFPLLWLGILIFLGGTNYLSRGRKKFLFKIREVLNEDFDSI